MPGRRSLLHALSVAAVTPWLASRASAADVVRPWPMGKAAPALDLVDLDGQAFPAGAIAGRAVVLNFWATWCEPCRLEMPSLDALAARHAGDGLAVVAVNYREPADKVRQFFERSSYASVAGFKPTVLLDRTGDVATAWQVRAFPTTVLIGRDGKPAQLVMGDLDWTGAEAAALIAPLLAPRGGGRA